MAWRSIGFSASFHRCARSGGRGARGALAALALVLLGSTAAPAQNGFPYGRELLMDATPQPGSKRVPILDVKDNGLAEITLWCASAPARLIVVADTITVLIGPKSDTACSPEQMQRDDALLGLLSQATNWEVQEDALLLTGGPTPLRFLIQTN